jgi:hypothetical protein
VTRLAGRTGARRLREPVALALACAFAPAQADDAAIQRALIERDLQTDRFALELRQWQEGLYLPPGDLRRRQALEARQLGERQRFDRLGERQLESAGRPLSPDSDTARQLLPYERERAARERAWRLAPPVEMKPRAAEPAPALPDAPRSGVDPVTPPPAQ